MDHKEIVKAGYNTIAPHYLTTRTVDSDDMKLLPELIQRLPVGARVLDAGCGAGVPVTKLLCQFFEVTGVDFAEGQLELARQLVPEAHFLCQDLTQLDLPDNSFDAICSYYVIIHIPRQEHPGLFRNFHRMLKPRGLALLCVGANDLVDDIDDNYLGTRMYWSHHNAETNLHLLKEAGFEIVWSKRVEDSHPGSDHLFVLAQKGES